MKHSYFLFLLLSIFFSSQSYANLVTVDPDAYANGTVINSGYSGVALSVTGEANTNVISIAGTSVFLSKNIATTGNRVFGQSPGAGPAVYDNDKLWDQNVHGLLRVDFLHPTNYVQIDLIFDDDDIASLWAYDSHGNLVQSVTALGDGRGPSSGLCPPYCTPTATAIISRSYADISYVLAGGNNEEAIYLDNLKYKKVPEPPILGLFVLGLIYLMFTSKRIGIGYFTSPRQTLRNIFGELLLW